MSRVSPLPAEDTSAPVKSPRSAAPSASSAAARRSVSCEREVPAARSSLPPVTWLIALAALLIGLSLPLGYKYVRRDEVVLPSPNPIHLKYIEDFLTPAECLHLRTIASGLFNRSEAGGRVNPIRTSFTAYLDRAGDEVIRGIENRVSKLTRSPLSHLEELHVVRYEPGQRYGTHWDDDTDEVNPRRYTVLAYLNDMDEDEGGETHFPDLDFAAKPKQGAALFWRNFNADKKMLVAAEHQGMPPITGVKYAMNCWIHFEPRAEYEPDYVDPESAEPEEEDIVQGPFQTAEEYEALEAGYEPEQPAAPVHVSSEFVSPTPAVPGYKKPRNVASGIPVDRPHRRH